MVNHTNGANGTNGAHVSNSPANGQLNGSEVTLKRPRPEQEQLGSQPRQQACAGTADTPTPLDAPAADFWKPPLPLPAVVDAAKFPLGVLPKPLQGFLRT